MKRIVIMPLLLLYASGAAFSSEQNSKSGSKSDKTEITELSPEGKKNMLPDGGWFIWKFAEKPKLGTVIVTLQAYSKDGKKDVSAEVIGEYGMPSMPYHDSGPVKFQKNKKGRYLLPVNIVMAGEWEIVIRVTKKNKEIYAGKALFAI